MPDVTDEMVNVVSDRYLLDVEIIRNMKTESKAAVEQLFYIAAKAIFCRVIFVPV